MRPASDFIYIQLSNSRDEFATTSRRISRQTYYTIIALRYGMVTYATPLCSGQYHVDRHDTLFTL